MGLDSEENCDISQMSRDGSSAVGGVSDQDAPYLRIRVCCKTLKITKLEAAAGQAGKHCLTMFGMERTKTTGLHREHVVSIRTLSITAYMSAGG